MLPKVVGVVGVWVGMWFFSRQTLYNFYKPETLRTLNPKTMFFSSRLDLLSKTEPMRSAEPEGFL